MSLDNAGFQVSARLLMPLGWGNAGPARMAAVNMLPLAANPGHRPAGTGAPR
jgi:hypothetical protein